MRDSCTMLFFPLQSRRIQAFNITATLARKRKRKRKRKRVKIHQIPGITTYPGAYITKESGEALMPKFPYLGMPRTKTDRMGMKRRQIQMFLRKKFLYMICLSG